MNVLLVVVGAAIGAPLRYVTDRFVQGRHDSVFPWGTFAVNVVGSLLFGAVFGAAPADVQLLLGTGFCGALTTYSTFSYETLQLVEQGAKLFAAANVIASLGPGLAAAFLGAAVGQAIW